MIMPRPTLAMSSSASAPPTGASLASRTSHSHGVVNTPSRLTYEHSDINAITIRQLSEDINAYEYDLDFCNQQLTQPDLTPQESRNLQLRRLDMGHHIRRCHHRLELLQIGTVQSPVHIPSTSAPAAATTIAASTAPDMPSPRKLKRESTPDARTSSPKRARTTPAIDVEDDGVDAHLELRRLGYWRCRLCTSPKYLLAGLGRLPSAPCKWPLKDIAKMITHFTELHTEHEPAERCMELGAALEKNRGPFEYWLGRSRSQNLKDRSVIDESIQELQAGRLPSVLRRLSRAAAGFPQE